MPGIYAGARLQPLLGADHHAQSTLTMQRNGLSLLSLDAGGSRGISQLKILTDLMHRLNYESESNDMDRPCAVFDMICGVGSGGFIAILLTLFGLTANEALEEFINLSTNILDTQGVQPDARTAALKVYIHNLLTKYGIKEEMRLMDPNPRSHNCKLVVPISYNNDLRSSCKLRNFSTRTELAMNITISDALLVTLATPPLFSSASISKDAAKFEFLGGDLIIGNPAQEILAEAHEAFGSERYAASLLSIGCGHPGVIAAPTDASLTNWNNFLDKIITDNEQKAQSMERQMGHLGLYYRISVTRGLERTESTIRPNPGAIIAHTSVYLSEARITHIMDRCVDSLKIKDGVVSLGQLTHSGARGILPPSIPSLTRTFVMRKGPWEFIERAMFGFSASSMINSPRMLAITGIGGCGKTQIILHFMEVHASKFESKLCVDGSSKTCIRADIIRYVRSLGTEHSQMGFEDCLLFLAQSSSKRPRLILYDNVDDPELELTPLIPRGTGCAIIITSRNRSIGGLCRDAHLELDIMSMDEAVELLLYTPENSKKILEKDSQEAREIAQVLGCLPIALTQARSYMYQTQCSARAYLERLVSGRDKLLAKPVKYQPDMRHVSTYAAFDASFERLAPHCQKFLRLLSYFHWSKFPLELVILAAKYEFVEYEQIYIDHGDEFYNGKALLEEIFLREDGWDATNLDEMIISLQNYSLVTLVPGIETMLLQMHPLAHGWANSRIPEQEQPRYKSAAIVLLALGARKVATPSAQYLCSHATHLSPLWDQLHVNDAGAIALILNNGGSFEGALQLREKMVTELRNEVDPDDIGLCDSIGLVAGTYLRMGRFAEAEVLQVEVLKRMREIQGVYHPDTISASNNLAECYRCLGRLAEAEVLQAEVLRLRTEIQGESHPDTITASHNLGETYRALGYLKEAETLQKDVLRWRMEVQGERHPDTIRASSNLALTYRDLGRLADAEALQEDVLRLRKEVLGYHHPKTAKAMLNLANTCERLGKIKDALDLLNTAENIIASTLGTTHPQYRRCVRIKSKLQGVDGSPLVSPPISNMMSPTSGQSSSPISPGFDLFSRLRNRLSSP